MLPPETPADREGGAGRSSLWARSAAGLAVVALVVATVAIRLWPEPPPPAAGPDEDDEDDRALAVVNPGYIGIEACAECHTDRAAEFKTTRHYLACTLPGGVRAPGFSPGRGGCDTRFSGLRFEMSRKGDDHLVTCVRSAPGGEERTTYRVGLVYGSGNKRDEMYFAWQDERLLRIPVAWLYPAGQWGADVDTDRVLDTHPSCLECHNTWITHVPGSPIRYRREGMHLGVTCERCHGPGRDHAEFHRQRPDDPAHAILHPGTLSRDRLMDVCAQCHGNTRLLGRPFTYRPGEPLDTAYRTARARYREDDTTTNQVQYLGESKCFQKSEMTCITCHDPHTTAPPHSGCLTCHTAASCKDQPHQPPAVRGDCVGCHMPQHLWMNSHFYTTRDDHYLPVAPRSEHRIAVYPWAKKAVVLAWLKKQTDEKSRTEAGRLAAELTDHWLGQAEQRRRAGRHKAAIGAYREALQITPSPKVRRRMQEVIRQQTELDDLFMSLADAERRGPDEAVRALKKILDLKPDDPRAHSQLGTIYATTGRRAEAVPHLEAVAKYSLYDSSGLTRLAWMAHVEGRQDEAASLCARAEKIEPGQPENAFVWAMALAKQRRWADAEKLFRKVLRNNPTHGGANVGLSEMLRHQGQAAEAVRFARRAVRWGDSKSPEVLLNLADAYAAANRAPDARKALWQALAAAESTNPPLADAIRQRLNRLQ